MSDKLFADLSSVLDQKQERDEQRADEVVVRRASSGRMCNLRIVDDGHHPGRMYSTEYRNEQRFDSVSQRRWIDCPRPAAFELRGNVKLLVCATHLAWGLDYYLVEQLDDLDAHYGRHCSIIKRGECDRRPMFKYGEPFFAEQRCKDCDYGAWLEKQACARNARRVMRNASRRLKK